MERHEDLSTIHCSGEKSLVNMALSISSHVAVQLFFNVQLEKFLLFKLKSLLEIKKKKMRLIITSSDSTRAVIGQLYGTHSTV